MEKNNMRLLCHIAHLRNIPNKYRLEQSYKLSKVWLKIAPPPLWKRRTSSSFEQT